MGIVSMYNDILKKATKPKSSKPTISLSIDGYVAKNALYRRFRPAEHNDFMKNIKETTVTSKPEKSKKKKKKKKGSKGFTLTEQEQFALAQTELKNSGRKGLGFGKPKQAVAPMAPVVSVSAPVQSLTKKKKKKKKK